MKNTIIILLLFVYCKSTCQVAVGYFPFNNSFIQLSSNPERLILGDIRLQTNTFSYNATAELAPFVNIKRSEVINLYIGPGISINPFYNTSSMVNLYFLTLGARIKPLRTNRNFAVLFELSPLFTSEPRNNILRSNLGISYNFKSKKAK